MNSDLLLDRIYEAALIPERWEAVLSDISGHFHARGAALFAASGVGNMFVVTPGLTGVLERFIAGNWDSVNVRRMRTDALDHQGFITDFDLISEEEMADAPIYRDFFWPEGLGWCTGTVMENPNGDRFMLSIEVDRSNGPVERPVVDWLDMLRPHLARSLTMAARAKQQLATTVAQTLEAFGLPACVLNDRGRLIAANGLFQKLIPSVLMDRRDRVHLHHGPSDQLFEIAITHGMTRMGRNEVQSIPVPATESSPASVLHVLHVRGEGRDLVPGGLFILAITVLAAQAVPDATILRGLFDLTPTESRIARLIAKGVQPRDVHLQALITANTAKAHLKSIYAKTGVSHQGGLVRLLSGASLTERDA